MDCLQAIQARHSYRGPYSRTPVPDEHLRLIVEAGILAPSGYNGQTTSFVVVSDTALLEPIRRIAPDTQALATCPALIAVVMDAPEEIPAGRTFFGIEDYSAAVENMLLAATALGYASVWFDGVLRSEGRARLVGDLLGVPPQKEVRVLLPIGVPAEPLEDHGRRPFEERAHWNGW
ncbi:MAG: nitroreductase [Chloroflexi bacterium]|jgi:nitroreductase|nr:nitroreductase [Chloroflexota bacterium]